MKVKFGEYNIKTHELDSKLSVQISSDLGEIKMNDAGEGKHDFPNAVGCRIQGIEEENKPKAKGMKKFSFGEYTFILGINYAGDLLLFHSIKLNVGRKKIRGKDVLTLSFLSEPKA